jgi:hypothetical protein
VLIRTRRPIARPDIEAVHLCCYIKPVEIRFDPAKRRRNLVKHGLDLADAAEVLEGVRLETLDDRFDYGEERWLAIGMLRGQIVHASGRRTNGRGPHPIAEEGDET